MRASMIVAIGLTYLLLPGTASADSDKPGDLLWENRGQPAPLGRAYAVAAEANFVVAAGDNCATLRFSTCDWFVRAYDSATGVTLWEDRLDVAGRWDSTWAVAVHARRVFAAGWVFTPAQGYDFVVRAYGLSTGALLWERRIDRGGRLERAFAIVADGGQVFAAGEVLGETGSVVAALLALDAQTGVTLWETEASGAPNQQSVSFAAAGAVRVQGERVFMAGDLSSTAPSGSSMFVQAHDRKTGALLWEHQIPDATSGPTAVDALVVAGDRLVVGAAAVTSDPNVPWDFMVRAIDVRTGALAWMDQVHRQAGGRAAGLGFGAGKLFAYGWDCDATVFNCHGNVRAYDPRTGTLQWEDRFAGPGGDMNLPIPTSGFVVRGNHVFVGSGLLNLQGDYAWTVRAYNGNDGSLRWQSGIDDGGSNDLPFGLTLLGGRLYAAGTTDRSDGGFDFTVRAYRAPTGDDRSPERD